MADDFPELALLSAKLEWNDKQRQKGEKSERAPTPIHKTPRPAANQKGKKACHRTSAASLRTLISFG
jgi:hypothetical protein